MGTRRQFLTAATGVSAASIAGCVQFPGEEVAVTIGRAAVVGTSVEVTATVESIGSYDELEAYFQYRTDDDAEWRYVAASPATVDSPTALAGLIDGVDDPERYEWGVSLWHESDAVATGTSRSTPPDESRGPPSAAENGLVTIDYDEYADTGEIYEHWLDDYRGTPERHQWTDDPDGAGDRVLEMPFGEGVDHAGNAALALAHDDLGVATNGYGRVDRLYQQFQLYLPEEFELPADDTLRFCFGAMSFSSGEAHSGGGQPDGTNGWSTRPYLTRREAADGSPAPDDGWHVADYTYHMDQPSPEAGDSVVFGDVVVPPGEWLTIETEVVCNRWAGVAANADGSTRCWVDGELAYAEDGFRWVTTESNAIEFCGFNGYYWPGDEGSPTDQSIYFKNHAVSTTPRSLLLRRSTSERP